MLVFLMKNDKVHYPMKSIIIVSQYRKRYLFFLFAVILCNDARSVTLSLPLLGIAILLGYFLADAVSGFVHFAQRYFGGGTHHSLGKTFIFPFREHHRDQLAITRHDFCNQRTPLLLHFRRDCHASFLRPSSPQAYVAFLHLGSHLFTSVFATNQIHKWAHLKNPPIL
jgi:ubiquitin-conjugating enzyme E2 variant